MLFHDDHLTKDQAELITGYKRATNFLALTEDEHRYLLFVARITARNKLAKKQTVLGDFSSPPEGLLIAKKYMVFVGLYVAGQLIGCKGSDKGNLIENTITGTWGATKDERFGGLNTRNQLNDMEIEIQIFSHGQELKKHDIKDLEKSIQIGRHAISVQSHGKRAFYKNDIPVTRGWGVGAALEKLCLKEKLPKDTWKSDNAKIVIYDTIHFTEKYYSRYLEPQVIPLHRSHPLFLPEQVSRETVETGLFLCGRYLANNVNTEGRLNYEVDPTTGEAKNPVGPSALRNLAAIWVLAETSEYFDSTFFKKAVTRHLEYVIKNFYKEHGSHGYFEVEGPVKLGMAAFFLLAINALNDPSLYSDQYKKVLEFVFAAFDKNTESIFPWYNPKTHSFFDEGKAQLFYPGEVLTAFMLINEKHPDSRFTEMTERVFPYYERLFNAHEERRSLIGWMSKPYAKLFRITGDRKYADFVFKMSDLLAGEQIFSTDDRFDRSGSFATSALSFSNGVWLEGIVEALSLAQDMGLMERVEKYETVLQRGLRYILQLQFNDNRIIKTKIRDRVLGGIATSPTKLIIRSDNQQHCGYTMLRSLQVCKMY